MPRARKSARQTQDGDAAPAGSGTRDAAPRTRQRPHEAPSDAAGRAQIPGSVVRKLIAFSLLLLVAPILVYFASLNLVFSGSTAPAAIAAAVTANVVLAAYVYVAWVEDQDSHGAPAPKLKAS